MKLKILYNMHPTCPICLQIFTTNRPKQRYCSDECRSTKDVKVFEYDAPFILYIVDSDGTVGGYGKVTNEMYLNNYMRK